MISFKSSFLAERSAGCSNCTSLTEWKSALMAKLATFSMLSSRSKASPLKEGLVFDR